MDRPFDSFVLFAEMRTGSNYLEDALNGVPGLCCHGEAFNPHFIGHKDRTEHLGVTLAERERDPGRLLAAMRAAAQGGLWGFRFFHDHDARVLAPVLADRRCAKILLVRNPVESHVSRLIADRTGQWRLTDLLKARRAQVRFDPADFADRLDRLGAFRAQLTRRLQVAGQTPFRIGYDQIADVEVLNGLLAFLGTDARLDAAPTRLKKQNPGPLSARVQNFDEMTRALADLDPCALFNENLFEPRRGPALRRHVAAPRSPLLFLPVPGGPVAEVEAWLAALDGLGPEALRRGFTRKTLDDWLRRHPGHRSFTVISHPLERAHRAFCRHVLPVGPDSFPRLRRALRELYGVPLPEDGPGPGYDAAAHRAAFLGFLTFLKGQLGGQSALRVDPSWASQSVLLEGMAQSLLPDRIVRAETLGRDLAELAASLGRAAPALPDPAPVGPVPLAAIHDADLDAAAAEAYRRDFLRFGYGGWRG
ncbi:nodulation protein NodH [Rhodovulum viride]|uniref:Nodulation protein NodH n=1 Tax=Rhodovulum viride TaxID=1231134 RepID=A0ABX9DD86_9RHOB|nr:nodulation protein NodH [Rhodovulum viride]RAP40063.1 nodulation protein NodH [Rhodovulum viride]